MTNRGGSRHYRVVKKEVEQAPTKGVFIPKNKKSKLMVLFVGVITIAFLKGLLLGLLCGKNYRD